MVLLLVWILAIAVRTTRTVRRRLEFARSDYAHMLAAGLIVTALFTPYGWWQTLFARRLAGGPYAADFLIEAAAAGDLRTLTALAEQGAPVTGMDHEGDTSIGVAARADQVPAIAFLLSRGVSINMLDAAGDSPLDGALAIGIHAPDAVRYLIAHGAERIHGSTAQHECVVQTIVDRRIQGIRGKAASPIDSVCRPANERRS